MITLAPQLAVPDGDEPSLTKGPLLRGTTIGRYVVTRVVGSGSGGIVYEAYDPQLGRRVGLKLLRLGASGGTTLMHLLTEAQAMARLSHPNVIGVFDAGVFEQCVYIVVEFVQGQTLSAWLREAPRTVAEILKAFVDVGNGLSAAHHAGVIHRDFKPDNVLVTSSGIARLTDFGLALNIEEVSQLGPEEGKHSFVSMGTPAFMAPEQKAYGLVGIASDQYSYCLALKWALLGGGLSTPNSPQRSSIISRLESAGVVVDRKRVPSRIQRAISRGLETDPARRFATMDELLAELLPRQVKASALPTAATIIVALVVGVFSFLLPSRKAEDIAAAMQTFCAEGQRGIGGHCFFYDRHKYSHQEAQLSCESKGGYLATCLSRGECQSIEDLVPNHDAAWVGLTRDNDNVVSWNTDEVVLAHVQVESQIVPKLEPTQTWCAAISRVNDDKHWQWSDCNTPRGSVCEVPSWSLDKVSRHSYRVIATPLEYLAAKKMCRRLGGELAAPSSQRRQDFLEAYLATDITTYPVLWIGATRALPSANFKWSNGEPLSWSNFAKNQPDNYEGQQGCLALDLKSKGWHDRYCSSRYQSICEFENLVPNNL